MIETSKDQIKIIKDSAISFKCKLASSLHNGVTIEPIELKTLINVTQIPDLCSL